MRVVKNTSAPTKEEESIERTSESKCNVLTYRTRATIIRGYNYFFLKSHVGFSLMIGGIPLKMHDYKTREVINQVRLITARVW